MNVDSAVCVVSRDPNANKLFQEISKWNELSDEIREDRKSRWTLRGNRVEVIDRRTSHYVSFFERESLSSVFSTMKYTINSFQLDAIKKASCEPNYHALLEQLQEKITTRRERWIETQESRNSLSKKLCCVNGEIKKTIKESNKLLLLIHELLSLESRIEVVVSRIKGAKKPKPEVPTVKLNDEPFQLLSTDVHGDLRPAFVQAIEKAQNRIVIFIYSVTDLKIMEALEKKAQHGVDVTIFHDKDAFKYAPRPMNPAVHLRVYNCPGLMHLKIIAIDDSDIVVGSANLTTNSMTKDGNIITALKCSELVSMVYEKVKLIDAQKEIKLPIKKIDSVDKKSQYRTVSVADKNLQFSFVPRDVDGDDRLLSYISSAQKILKVAIFTFTNENLAKAMIDRKNSGVDVQVVIDHTQGIGCGKRVFNMLSEAGVHVHLSKGNRFKLLHYKLAVIDQKTMLYGSANWTAAAFSKNEECFAVIDNLASQDLDLLDAMWNKISSNVITTV